MGKRIDKVKTEFHVSLLVVRSAYSNQPIRRVLISPNFTSLWYKIQENEFDNDLYNDLEDSEKDILSFIMKNSEFGKNKQYQLALQKDNKKLIDKLKILEGAVVVGNTNPEIIDEMEQVLRKLEKNYILPAWTRAAILRNIKKISEVK